MRLSSAGVSEVKQSHRPTGEVEEVTILGYPDIRVSRIKNVVIVAVCPLRRKIHPLSERRRGTEDEGWRKGERGKDFKAMEEEQLRVKERGREEEGKEGGRGRKVGGQCGDEPTRIQRSLFLLQGALVLLITQIGT